MHEQSQEVIFRINFIKMIYKASQVMAQYIAY